MTEKNKNLLKPRPNPMALGLILGSLFSMLTGSPVFLGVELAIGAALKKRREKKLV